MNWYEMMMTTEENILPPGVSWREYADHCLTHDPLPGHGCQQGLHSLPQEQPAAALLLRLPV